MFVSQVTKAVALGDLSKRVEVDAKGEILDLKNTVNGMVVRFVDFVLSGPCPVFCLSFGPSGPSLYLLEKAYNLNSKLDRDYVANICPMFLFTVCKSTSHVSPTLPYERWIPL